MLTFTETIRDQYGRAVSGAQVYIYAPNPTFSNVVLASLTSDGATPTDNPLTTDEYGEVEFYADAGAYRMDVWVGGKRVWSEVIEVGAELPLDDGVTLALGGPGGAALIGHLDDGTSAVPRTVAAKLSERVSVLDYGAVGDETTDNTAALQAAIDAVQISGAALEVPPGTYRIDDQVQIRAPIKFIGQGAAKFVISDGIVYGSADTNGGGGFDVLDVTGVTFANLSFESEETDDISNIIHFRGCSEISVTGCRFASPVAPDGSKCIVVQRSPNVSEVRNVSILGNQFIDAPAACLVIGEAAEPPTNIAINGNVYEGRASSSGAAFKVDKYSTNVVISGNSINGNGFTEEGITVEQGSEHVTITGNTLRGIADYAIKCADDSGDGGGLPFNDVLIEGNHIAEMTGGTGHGIRLVTALNAGDNITIRGNVISGVSSGIVDPDGISTDLVVADNVVIDASGTAINVKSNNAIVARNIVKGGASDYSYSGGGASGQKIIDNVFEQNNGNAACDINYGSSHGTDTIMRGNIGLRANGERLSAGTVTLAPGMAVSELYTSGGAITATLPNGTYVGQRKMIHHASTGTINSSTVSVTNHATSDPEVFTFAARNSTLILEWMGNEWITVANSGVTV